MRPFTPIPEEKECNENSGLELGRGRETDDTHNNDIRVDELVEKQHDMVTDVWREYAVTS